MQLFDLRGDSQKEFDEGIPVIVYVSGGKDSTALILWIKKKYPRNPITAVYHDTGFEHPGVWEYIENISGQIGILLERTTPPEGGDLLSLVKKRGRIPGFGCRYCTSALKVGPGNKWIRKTYPTGKVIQCFGFRAEESEKRAKKQVWTRCDAISTQNREVLNYAPLLDWKSDDIIEFVRGEGFELFHTYEYLSRLSCRYCFLAGRRDREATQLNDPEGWDIVEQTLGGDVSYVK
jgi:3'-phosphoadenosine 5'-phosphosulfate sulfotransferase (PAPS reductase)/FAD synthetase